MTTTQELGTIARVNIRDVWKDEAVNFTPWLAEHLSELGEALNLELDQREVEAPVGGYRLDLLARDMRGDRPVVIENQLDATNHTHLGQLLTYAAGYDANVAIWIAGEFRDEHREALDLLNRRTDEETEFFGVVVEVWRIRDSPPAPHFSVVSAPNDWRKSKVGSPSSSRHRAFFQSVADRWREQGRGVGKVEGNHFSPRTGVGGFYYDASFRNNRPTVRLYIDRGSSYRDSNERRFDELKKSKDDIESKTGRLEWQRMDHTRACSISAVREEPINDDETAMANIREWMIERLLKFEEVFGPRLAELRDV